MRGWILLALAAVVSLSTAYLGLERFYLAPIETANQRIADLTAQLDALRERELVARREQVSLGNGDNLLQLNLADKSGEPGVAAAQLQVYARATVAHSDGLATSSQVVVAELTGGYSKLSVLLRMRIAEEQLLDFIRKVETHSPPIMFDSLEVRLLPTSPDSRYLDVTAALSGFHGSGDAR